MIEVEDIRTGLDPHSLSRAILDNLYYVQGRVPMVATRNDWYMALATTVRDRMLRRWINTIDAHIRKDVKLVSYLSAEFLIGPQLGKNLIDLGIYDQAKEAVQKLGLNLEDLIAQEDEPGLGNGGLGRLAACFLDSMATLEIPAIGYGIRYEFGIFDQEIRDGWQVEVTDKWLRFGNAWEIPRPEISYPVKLGGRTEPTTDEKGRYRVRWIPERVVKGVAYDTPILGYNVTTCDLLRLWKAEAAESFDFQAFNTGNYYGAVNEKIFSENISKVLYPNDEKVEGKQLRLEQQILFTSCSLQDMIRMHFSSGHPIDRFHEKFAIQLNDTHPAIAVAELMRLLVDDYAVDWEKAWEVTQKTFGYTNHTLLPEALEKWPLSLFGRLLPRHLEIIYEINRRFLDEVRAKHPGDEGKVARLSLIDESGGKFVRMANLASLGSHAINGVAALHSDLLKKGVLRDFYDLTPEKFTNVTNGVTPRRWVALSNPKLASLITRRLGRDWLRNYDADIIQLEKFAEDPDVRAEWRKIKRANKQDLADIIKNKTGVIVNPDSLFDIQVKRIHEYKRQHLNVLHVITLYHRLRHDPQFDTVPRTVIFGGKAAPGYFLAKLIIKLINSVAEVVNNDPVMKDRLKIVFLPDFNVKHAQRIYPAADLSEQISTAGKEASGTGNMKFSMNGALTIGTLDGANIEIRDAVGHDNFFLFGLTAEEVVSTKMHGYHPLNFYNANTHLQEAIDLIRSGHFSKGDRNLFKSLTDALLYWDEFMVLADYQSYVDCQEKVALAYRDTDWWTRMSIRNAARSGSFSSDRSIREYADKIWNVRPVPVEMS